MYIGTPPHPYILDIDTGSTLTWICSATHLHTSSTARRISQENETDLIMFRDRSHQQVTYATDVIYLSSAHQPNIPMADVVIGIAHPRSTDISSGPVSASDGILGLGRAFHVPNGVQSARFPNVVAALHERGILCESAFSVIGHDCQNNLKKGEQMN